MKYKWPINTWKKCSTSLAIRQTQSKLYFDPISCQSKWISLSKWTMTTVGRERVRGACIHCWWGKKINQYGSYWKTWLPRDPALPVLWTHPKELKSASTEMPAHPCLLLMHSDWSYGITLKVHEQVMGKI